MSEGLEAILFLSFSFFLVGSVGDVSRVLLALCFACLGYESCCCSRLSQPFSKAKFRDDVGAIPDERACLGYESCCCSRLSQPFSKAKFRDDVGAIPDERTWL